MCSATEKSLNPLVKLIQKVLQENDPSLKVVFAVGAGISTSAGIPDFRSPKTGLYHNLSKLNLPYPEAVFDIDFFAKNPKPFNLLCNELYPGKFLPTKFHYLIKLFHDKNLLKRCYTQNIDNLERLAGLPDDKVVEAHGSFVKNHCIKCHEELSIKEFRSFLVKDEIPKCSKCKNYVKPDIVFFGEALPHEFFDKWDEDLSDGIDVCIVAGTSLQVYPFATLPGETPDSTWRILINREKCGDFEMNSRKKDLVLLGDADEIASMLIKQLGWEDDLNKLLENGRALLKENKLTLFKDEELIVETAEERSKELAKEIAEVETAEEKKPIEEDKNVTELLGEIEKLDIGSKNDNANKDSKGKDNEEKNIKEKDAEDKKR
ncbi:hypothetical protein PACTADRAFT_40529 [Pachysolen tannophilus NRRL Y-2460]|uniref:NAD-dependent protein deacetylase n=1 Tax=Pachysolen tannophilus NRRL Y-2460 TaxID=669874 RepID=A0A1E4TWB6_PACTA|nr:hypothetical protein PACTADRAFT_40529 [Pachysolen tannophilus NRRL Y-2460]